MAFPKYKSYKDSDIPWVKEIPSTWKIERAKWLFKKMERPVRPGDEIVTAFRDGEVTLRKNRREDGFTNALQEHGYQGIRKGDLIIHAMDAFAGAIGVSDSDGKSTPVYSVCTPCGEFYLNNYYYAYLLRYMAKSGFIQSLSKGIRERSTDFRFNDFANLSLPIPPLEEQQRIVAFLNRTTAEIDEAIAKKQRLIELLQEQKAILINQAVTKGLNPNVPMRNSGVEWIGEIPKHWKVKKVRWICSSVRDGTHNPPPAIEGEYRLLSVRNIVNGEFITRENDRTMTEVAFRTLQRSYHLEIGDVVVALVGGTTGKSAVVKIDCEKITVQRSIGILRPIKSQINSQFLNFSIQAQTVQKRIWEIAKKYAAQPGIYLDDLAKLQIICPDYNEQLEIVDYLINLQNKYSELIQTIEKEIEKICIFKSSLIEASVTGKIKI